MATETIKPTSMTGDWSGFASNIDEGISTPDGSIVRTSLSLAESTIGLTDIVDINDIDTVNNITIKMRARADVGGASPYIDVTLNQLFTALATERASLTTSYQTFVLTNAAWDSDWTVSELDSMSIKIAAGQASPDSEDWQIDTIDVEIDYTPLVGIDRDPDAESLSLSGNAPTPDIQEFNKIAEPTVGGVSVTGEAAPTFRFGIGFEDAGAANLNGKISVVNSQVEQLQPNGWDSAWSGFLTNIDEPVASADGSVVSSRITSGGTTPTLTLDFENTSNIVDEDTVLSVTFVVRAQVVLTSGNDSLIDADLSITPLVNGSALVPQNIALSESYVNATENTSTWNQDWSQQQLNSIQLNISGTGVTSFGTDLIIQVDAVDLLVEWTPQSPILITPPVTDLDIAGKQPDVDQALFRAPGAETLALTGEANDIGRALFFATDPDVLMCTSYAPTGLRNAIPKPSIETLALSGKTATRLVNFVAQPPPETLVLSGEQPTADTIAAKVRSPGRRVLSLDPENPIADAFDDITVGPPRERLFLNEKSTTADRSENYWIDTAAETLVLAGAAPALVDSTVPAPQEEDLSLTGQAPSASIGTKAQPAATSLALTSDKPQLGLLPDDLALAGAAPVLDTSIPVGEAALAFDPKEPRREVDDKLLLTVSLTLTSSAPTYSFTTQLGLGDPQLVSLTVERDIEHISTPTDNP